MKRVPAGRTVLQLSVLAAVAGWTTQASAQFCASCAIYLPQISNNMHQTVTQTNQLVTATNQMQGDLQAIRQSIGDKGTDDRDTVSGRMNQLRNAVGEKNSTDKETLNGLTRSRYDEERYLLPATSIGATAAAASADLSATQSGSTPDISQAGGKSQSNQAESIDVSQLLSLLGGGNGAAGQVANLARSLSANKFQLNDQTQQKLVEALQGMIPSLNLPVAFNDQQTALNQILSNFTTAGMNATQLQQLQQAIPKVLGQDPSQATASLNQQKTQAVNQSLTAQKSTYGTAAKEFASSSVARADAQALAASRDAINSAFEAEISGRPDQANTGLLLQWNVQLANQNARALEKIYEQLLASNANAARDNLTRETAALQTLYKRTYTDAMRQLQQTAFTPTPTARFTFQPPGSPAAAPGAQP